MCSKELITSASKQSGHEINLADLENQTGKSGVVDGIFYACKELPNNNTLAIVAFGVTNISLTKADKFSSDGGYIDDLISMVIDTKNKNLIAKYTSIGAIESNAIALQSLEIDTGRYYLESGSLIFGVRSRSAANSHAYIADYTQLFLYRLNKNLQIILNGLEVESASGDIEGNCDVKSEFKNSKRTLSVPSSVTNGMHDIEVIEKNNQETTAGCSDEANLITPTKGRRIILKFNGEKYPIPKGW